MTPADISFYIDSHLLAYIFITEILDMTLTLVFITLKHDLYILLLFFGKLYGFYGEMLLFLEREMVSKSFVFAHSHFLF